VVGVMVLLETLEVLVLVAVVVEVQVVLVIHHP
jgi:hypothetical protein